MNFTVPSTGTTWVDKISWPFITAVIGSLVTLAASFGFEVSAEQVAGINVFVAAVASLLARQKVTPWKPDLYGDWSAAKLAGAAEVWKDPEGTEAELAKLEEQDRE